MNSPSKSEIWKMFDAIASTYDRTNRFISAGLDLAWRKKMAEFLPEDTALSLIDCATGTGDQIISLMEPEGKIAFAAGIDLSHEMLKIGRKKIEKKPYAAKVQLLHASALQIPYGDEVFDVATISFGIRNVTDVKGCLQEIRRVLKKGGKLLVLESSLPENRILKTFHLFYLRKILPKIGKLISKNEGAYVYLNETTESFPSGMAFCNLLESAGFKNCKADPLLFGAASIYTGEK